ncbi:MAG TPA: hypothetical protein VN517_10260, partial [Terriglobales bacterium]|nr:hypothetical protein [Terriglobales bacterium]
FRLGEGLSVAILGSIALKLWGLEAFAAVIMVTLLTTSIILVPRHMCKVLGISLRQYFCEGILKPSILAVPTIIAYVMIEHTFQITGWRDLLVAALAGSFCYVGTLALATFVTCHSTAGYYRLDVLQIVVRRLFATSGGKQVRPGGAPILQEESWE